MEILNATKKASTTKTIEIGDIFVCSWGYDQTNYDFLTIISISKTGKTVKCRMVERENLGFSVPCNKQKPLHKPVGEVFTMRIKETFPNGIKPYIKGSYPFCNGSKRLDFFTYSPEDKVYYETDSQFGH